MRECVCKTETRKTNHGESIRGMLKSEAKEDNHGGSNRSIGSSSKVNAVGFFCKNFKIAAVLLSALLNAIREEKWKEYLGHSVRRCLCVCSRVKHVQPRGSWGKKRCQYSPVGAWPEIRRVKRLKVTMSPAIDMNFFLYHSKRQGAEHAFLNASWALALDL